MNNRFDHSLLVSWSKIQVALTFDVFFFISRNIGATSPIDLYFQMLCFFSLVSRAEMSLSISANTNFYEYIQMHFLHIVVETVLNSRQRTFLDLVDRFFLQRERATVSTSLMGRLRYPALDCAEVATSTFLIPASISKGSTDQCLLLLSQN